MRIKLDTSAIRFMITKPAAPKMDRETRQQKVDKPTGALQWQLQVMALDETGGEILTVTLDAEPKINVGEFVQLHDLVAIPWTQGDRSGVAFRAAGLTAAGKHQARRPSHEHIICRSRLECRGARGRGRPVPDLRCQRGRAVRRGGRSVRP